MGFSKLIKDEILVSSARHCCVCHRYGGTNIEIHHIKPQAEGGKDTLENAIALCFDCHANAGHYNPKHPKGLKYSQEELLLHKENWFKIVKEHNITPSKNTSVEVTVSNKNFDGKFEPIFIKQETRYIDKDSFKRVYELTGRDPMEIVNEIKSNNVFGPMYNPFVNKIETYDQFIDYLNGDYPKKDFLKVPDVSENTDCQPINYPFPSLIGYNSKKEINLSNCILNLKFTNHGPEVLENYKLYLTFDNVIEIYFVSKRNSWDDMNKYNYNIELIESDKFEFIPDQHVLVQNDSVNIDSICFRPNHEATEINVKWELFARNIHDVGNLKLEVFPIFENEEEIKYIADAKEMKPTTRVLPKIVFE